jgi:aminopeptidase N
MATDGLFPEWKIWTRFLQQTTGGLRVDALEGSHPIEVVGNSWFCKNLLFFMYASSTN